MPVSYLKCMGIVERSVTNGSSKRPERARWTAKARLTPAESERATATALEWQSS